MNPTADLVPAFAVRINGKALPMEARADLTAVSVCQDIDAPDMFTLRLINWDMPRLKVTWSDDALFVEGNQVAIDMGYVDHLTPLITGEITGLEPAFESGETPALTVRGYDRSHRLMRGRKTRSFTAMKDSDIAAQIAGDLGLTAQVEDTGVVHDYVLQHNQTDMEFLQRRAHRISYRLNVKDKTLYFQPVPETEGGELTLSPDRDLLAFYPRLTTLPQVGQVSVRAWNPQEKAPIVGQTNNGIAPMGGSTPGPSAADNAFGPSHTADVIHPVFTQAEADQVAQGQFKERALSYIQGEGQCIGSPDLRAGTVIDIANIGARFSGPYYITSATHTYTPSQGYRTAFTVRRNAT